jgi:hypothetical protein
MTRDDLRTAEALVTSGCALQHVNNEIPGSDFMKKILLGATTLAALTFGLSAHASCADPRSTGQGGAVEGFPALELHQGATPSNFGGRDIGERIVGTWHVIYTPSGSTTESGEAFIQWHSDGTEWENINYPVLGGNICLGSWKALDHSQVSRNHYGWLYNDGTLAGYFNETETDVVAWDGNSYYGSNVTTLYFFSGPPVVLKGTAKATRLAP